MTFGVLLSDIDHDPQNGLWRGIVDFAAKHGIHLIGYVGAHPSGDTDAASHMDTCLDMICNSKSLDGVIFLQHTKRFPTHIPCVSVTQIIAGIPSIMAEPPAPLHPAADTLDDFDPTKDYFAMGAKSASVLFALINGKPVPPVTYVPLASAAQAWEQTPQANHIMMRRITHALMLNFDIDTLWGDMCRLLPEVSINTMLMGLYETGIPSADPTAKRDITRFVGFDDNKRFFIDNGEMRFSDLTTLGDFNFYARRRTMLYMPLFFKDEELGALMVPYEPQIAMYVYDTLRINLSAAVKGAALLDKVKLLSVTDDLTGLYNRRGLMQFAYARLDLMQRNQDIMVPLVMFIDLDGLKKINDAYGHNEGDHALIAFSSLLKENLRKDDIISRIHGDEFVVLASVKHPDAALMLVNRLRDKVEHYNALEQRPYKINFSIGHVILDEATEACFNNAMQRADNALYDEKKYKIALGLARG